MRKPISLMVACLMMLAAMLQGCGRKGPLFLEPEPVAVMPPPVAASAVQPTQPTPLP